MLVLLCSTVNAASTPYEIQPRFTSIMQFDSQVTISADGYAECCTEVRLSDSSYTAALTMELQRSSNGRFGDTVKSWNTSAEGFASMAKGRFVSSGYKSLSANKQQWYNSHQRRWKKWRKRATSHGQYQMRSGRP